MKGATGQIKVKQKCPIGYRLPGGDALIFTNKTSFVICERTFLYHSQQSHCQMIPDWVADGSHNNKKSARSLGVRLDIYRRSAIHNHCY